MAGANEPPSQAGRLTGMATIEKKLSPGERVIFSTGMHWAVYLRATVVAVVGLAIVVLAPLAPAPKVAVLPRASSGCSCSWGRV
jgi:hypothetical protein